MPRVIPKIKVDANQGPIGWQDALHSQLEEIFLLLSVEDRKNLFYFSKLMNKIGTAKPLKYGYPKVVSGIQDEYPVATTLLLVHKSSSPVLIFILSAIMVSAAFDPDNSSSEGWRKVAKFSAIVRGTIRNPSSPIRSFLEQARSMSELVELMDQYSALPKKQVNPEFVRLWKNWLRPLIQKWRLFAAGLVINEVETSTSRNHPFSNDIQNDISPYLI